MADRRRLGAVAAISLGLVLIGNALWPAASEAATVTLTAIGRDFEYAPKSNAPNAHPDFENVIAEDRGMVTDTLGADGRPVYGNHPDGTATTTSKATFDQFFHDDPSVNVQVPIPLQFEQANGHLTFSDEDFFPFDGLGWNAPGRPNPPQVSNDGHADHNFSFTLELHTQFTYKQGDTFQFTSDDDLWIYVNKKLIVDLGGVTPASTQTLNLDVVAQNAGITPGGTYPFDLFKAERHTTGSFFEMDTTLGLTDATTTTSSSTTTTLGSSQSSSTTTTAPGSTATSTTTTTAPGSSTLTSTTTTTAVGAGVGAGGITGCTTAVLAATPVSVAAGGTTTVSGGCFVPNSDVSLTMFSDPVALGTVRADANGAFARVVTVPLSTSAGSHTITGVGSGRQASASINVVRNLPVSGAPVSTGFLLGIALLAFGAALAYGTRPDGSHYARRR